MTALPWLLLAATILVLLAAALGLLLDSRDMRRADDRIDDLTAANEQLEADNTNLTRNWQRLGADLTQVRRDLARTLGERDLARDTVRELLDAQAAGHRWPRPQPMPPPVGPTPIEAAVTEEFTRIVERNRWPEAPSS